MRKFEISKPCDDRARRSRGQHAGLAGAAISASGGAAVTQSEECRKIEVKKLSEGSSQMRRGRWGCSGAAAALFVTCLSSHAATVAGRNKPARKGSAARKTSGSSSGKKLLSFDVDMRPQEEGGLGEHTSQQDLPSSLPPSLSVSHSRCTNGATISLSGAATVPGDAHGDAPVGKRVEIRIFGSEGAMTYAGDDQVTKTGQG